MTYPFLPGKPLVHWQKAALDPSFWRALGIGLGNKEEMRCDSPRCDNPQCEYAGYKDPRRMYEQFCEIIWWDANIKSFWEELLK